MTRPLIQIYDASIGESVVREMNDAEHKEWQIAQPTKTQRAEVVRFERNAKLTASDWTQVAAAPVDQAAWAAYRQALRDVPQQSSFPTDIVWPTKPA